MVTEFHSFSAQHLGMLVFLSGTGTLLTVKGQRSDYRQKLNMAVGIAGITFATEVIETIIFMVEGRYDYLVDLPLFLCDLTALMLPFVLIYQNRKWLGILYFWAMAGTLQALLTPDLQDGFPTFGYFRYFIMHGGIVMAILYSVIVFRIRINWKDLIHAVGYAQLYLIFIHIINQWLGSNYSYTIQKPAGPTVLDYLGPWPWYILWGEVLMVVLFVLLWIPFLVSRSPVSPDEPFGSD